MKQESSNSLYCIALVGGLSHTCLTSFGFFANEQFDKLPRTHIHKIRQDACTPQWNDIKIALKAKMESDPNIAKEMLETTHYKQNLGSDLKVSPTAGIIWELKDPPGWDEVS